MRDWTTGFGASLFASLIFCGILPFLAGLLIDELGWMLLLGVPLVWLYRRLTTGRW
jgi:hypothetical protein